MSDRQLFLHGLITFFFHHSSCNKLWYKSYISKLSKRQIKGQTSVSHIMADICLAEYLSCGCCDSMILKSCMKFKLALESFLFPLDL